jgi:hypothetical protein
MAADAVVGVAAVEMAAQQARQPRPRTVRRELRPRAAEVLDVEPQWPMAAD